MSGVLDFDAGTTFYELSLEVDDGTNTATVALTMSVAAVNDGGPSFSGSLAATVLESASLGIENYCSQCSSKWTWHRNQYVILSRD